MTRLLTGRSPPWRLPAVQDLSPATQTQLKQAQHSPALVSPLSEQPPYTTWLPPKPTSQGRLAAYDLEPLNQRNTEMATEKHLTHQSIGAPDPLSRLHASKQITGLYISHKKKNHEQENWSFQTPGTLKHIFTQMVTDSTPPLSFHTAPEKLALDLQ